MHSKFYLRPVWLLLGAFSFFSAVACDSGGGRTGTGTATTPGTNTTTSKVDEPAPTGKGTASALEFGTLPTSALFTKEAAENTCVPFTIKAVDGTAAAADVQISLELQTSTGMTDVGVLTPTSGATDATGELAATYCSGESEGKIVIVAKYEKISVNSAKITVSKKPVYKFVYLRSDTDPLLSPADAAASSPNIVYLNLLDSGPQDCTNIYFKLTRSDAPVIGEQLTFVTQVDFPKGAKLGKRDEALQTKTDATTNKKYAYITSISSGAGEFAVPVCAGVSLGTLLVTATFVDEEQRSFTAKSPVIRITAGLTNYINMSLTFDVTNARTLKGYFNTNSNYELPVTVQLGARQDGTPITEYPVSIATEVGRVKIENGGVPDASTGAAKFSLQSLHLVNNYPFPVTAYTDYPLAQTRCEPESLALWGAGQSLSEVKYSDVKKNWRSTAVYSIRGQEHFHDANRNGVYDVGGDGFWDKNQNGIYDTGDTLTYDAGGDGLFNPLGEWFIDLPTPFVDVDEDGVFTSSKDLLMGDEYQAPNGKRDRDALLWKYEYFPISMGASVYGLQRHRIQTASYNSADNPVALPAPWSTSYPVFGLLPITATTLWGGAVTASFASYQSIIFAHDLCGNLLPGGTSMTLSFVAASEPLWGPRTPTGHFYIQPGDTYLEPTRHLLRGTEDTASGVINFNASDHPHQAYGYPIVSSIEVPDCVNVCTGDLAAGSPGVSCDGWAGYAYMTVKEPGLDTQEGHGSVTFQAALSFSSYVGHCNCPANADEVAGTCTCRTGFTYNSSTKVCQ